MTKLTIKTPRWAKPLLGKKRFKGAKGGRASGKSSFFAEAMVEAHVIDKDTNSVCIREIQKSLKFSAKKLIEDKIRSMGVSHLFDVTLSEIRRVGGEGIIIFQGMQDHTAESIKSLEGFDRAWVEEAQSLSARSLELLIPTIREPGSELWFSWNPDEEDDPVEILFAEQDDDMVCVHVNYTDNPFLPIEMQNEAERHKRRSPETFAHVWLGEYNTISDSKVFNGKFDVMPFDTPSNARFFHGADWGFSVDPTTLIRSFIMDGCLYIDQESYGVGVELDETPALFDSIPTARTWPIKADCSRPETISHVAKKGFNLSGAKKWAGSVEDGIAYLKSFKRIICHERCTHTAYELRKYSYKVDKTTGDVLPILVDKHNHCIAGGSMISVLGGDKPIEKVMVGDKVLTRDGYKKVLWSGVSDLNRKTYILKTESGRELKATGDHKIFTGRGFLRLDELEYGDYLLCNKGESQCQNQKFLSSMVKLSEDTQIQNAKQIASISSLPDTVICTDTCGHFTTANCQLAGMSTTKMETDKTTPLKTWLPFLQKSTVHSTSSKVKHSKGKSRISKGYGQRHQNGMEVKRAGSGIQSMRASLSRVESHLSKSARSAGKLLRTLAEGIRLFSAQANANRQTEDNLESMTGSMSAFVERNSLPASIQGKNFVADRVLCITVGGTEDKVYDLTIEGQHEFFANGILVHNCIDALRYAHDGYIGGTTDWTRII